MGSCRQFGKKVQEICPLVCYHWARWGVTTWRARKRGDTGSAMAMRTWIWGSLLLMGAAGYGLIEWVVDDWNRDFFANTAATSNVSNEVDLQPITSAPTPDAAQRAVLRAVSSLEGWEYVEFEDQQGDRLLRLTRTSPYLKLVDDILVTITNREDIVVIAATSASRSSWGDLGRNPRNIKQLFQAIRDSLWRD